MWTQHPDAEVRQALIRLCDALCSWERATGRQNLLLLIEQPAFDFAADCGKPLTDQSRAGRSPSEIIEAFSWMHNNTDEVPE
jgi:hypothetical protein